MEQELEKKTKHDWFFEPFASRFSLIVWMVIAAFIGSRIGLLVIPAFIAAILLAYLTDRKNLI